MTADEFLAEYTGSESFIEARTSGSTGEPRTIMLDKAFVRASALRTNSFFGIGPQSVLYSCVSPDFIGGKMMIARAIEAGCRCISEQPSNRPRLDAPVIDLLAVVPSQMHHILELLKEEPQLHHNIRNIIIGGQQIPESLAAAIEASGLTAWETYGMTETASHIALRRVKANPGPFLPLPGIKVSTDSRGCLVIEAPHPPKGGEKTPIGFIGFLSGLPPKAQSLKPKDQRPRAKDLIKTNDIAQILQDGSFYILGRADNVIVTGGRKVQPEPLEKTFGAYFGCRCLLTSRPDALWGQALVLLLEREALPDAEAAESFRAAMLAAGLESWQLPKEVRAVSSLPMLPSGKFDRRAAQNLDF